jgi:hypothetical protein
MPLWMEQVLYLLAQSRLPGRVRVAELLLAMDGDTRNGVGEQIARMRTLQQRQKRLRPISTGGDVRLTVSVSQKGSYQLDFAKAREHAIAVMTLQGERDRLIVWLQYSEHMVLEDVKWAILTKADADAIDAEILAERVRRLRASREKLERFHFRCGGTRSVENSFGTRIP